MGTETISANVRFYFFHSNIIFSVTAWCGGIDCNLHKVACLFKRVSRFLNPFSLPIACVQTSPISFHPRKSVHLVRMVSFSHYSVIEVCYFLFLQLDVTNKKIVHIEEGLHVFIKVQLGLFSAMIVLFAIVMYYASHSM